MNDIKSKPFIRISVFVIGIIITGFISAVALFYYVFSIPEPSGLSLASWPDRFTENFSYWIENDKGTLSIKETGLKRLDEYGLWIQIIDESGKEVLSYKKPASFPLDYSAAELLRIQTSPYKDGVTVFTGSYENAEETYGYMIGFPYSIGKYMLYYNGQTVSKLSPVFRFVILATLSTVFMLTFFYSIWLTKHLSRISDGINKISMHAYQTQEEKGMFKKVYQALNQMDEEIRCSTKIRRDTEKARVEWITNITHDLKTPLSPVKGYAELLFNSDEIDLATAKEYGEIILKNVNHTEKLINDLKLTYQLDSGGIPYKPAKIRINRYIKELVIDIMNDPAYSKRTIDFEGDSSDLWADIDTELFRRAFQNLLINALVHNPINTNVKVLIQSDDKNIYIFVCDNGAGISEASIDQLFSRYYRGTNTKQSSESTGLGLAITKQIIQIHSGTIAVESQLGFGTKFIICIPQS